MKFPAYITSFPTATRPSAVANLPSLQLNPVQQGNTSYELDLLISSSATVPEPYPDSSSSSVIASRFYGFYHSTTLSLLYIMLSYPCAFNFIAESSILSNSGKWFAKAL
jgi:hypothetical protein